MFNRQYQIKSQLCSETLRRTANFRVSQWVCGGDANSALVIDEGHLLVCLLSFVSRDQVDTRVITTSQVLSVEIVCDQASKGNIFLNQMTGAVIGGALFGDAGSIVGADSGKSLASESIKRIILQLTLNDTSNPFHRVLFFPYYLDTRRNKNQALEEAQRWQVLMTIMTKRAAEFYQPGLSPFHQEGLPANAQSVNQPARLPSPPVVPPRAPGCVLLPDGDGQLPPVHINRDVFTIGRGAGNDQVLNDPAVSRQHAVICLANDTWFIQDHGSRAGILVNGQRLQAARLTPGFHITIGSYRFIFHAD